MNAWITGPALEIMKQLRAFKPGDFVRARHLNGEAIILGISGDIYTGLCPHRGFTQHHRYNAYIHGITAWQRPPLDIELDP